MTQNTRKTTLRSVILAAALAAMMLTAPATVVVADDSDTQLQTIEYDADNPENVTSFYIVDEGENKTDENGMIDHVSVEALSVDADAGDADLRVTWDYDGVTESETVTVDDQDHVIVFEESDAPETTLEVFDIFEQDGVDLDLTTEAVPGSTVQVDGSVIDDVTALEPGDAFEFGAADDNEYTLSVDAVDEVNASESDEIDDGSKLTIDFVAEFDQSVFSDDDESTTTELDDEVQSVTFILDDAGDVADVEPAPSSEFFSDEDHSFFVEYVGGGELLTGFTVDIVENDDSDDGTDDSDDSDDGTDDSDDSDDGSDDSDDGVLGSGTGDSDGVDSVVIVGAVLMLVVAGGVLASRP